MKGWFSIVVVVNRKEEIVGRNIVEIGLIGFLVWERRGGYEKDFEVLSWVGDDVIY